MALNVREEFANITEFRKGLSELQERYQQEEGKDGLFVQIITEHGKPVAAAMPYRAYEALRQIIFVLKGRSTNDADVLSFPAGTPLAEISKALREKGAGKRKQTG